MSLDTFTELLAAVRDLVRQHDHRVNFDVSVSVGERRRVRTDAQPGWMEWSIYVQDYGSWEGQTPQEVFDEFRIEFLRAAAPARVLPVTPDRMAAIDVSGPTNCREDVST